MNRTLKTMLSAALLAAFAIGQDGADALARARLLEQQEGDLRAAEQAYRELVSGGAAAVQQEAALRLGSMLWRLERREDAVPFLERAVAAGGELAVEAGAVLQGKGEAMQQEAEVAAKVKDSLDRLLGRRGPPSGDPEQDLRWLGTAAVPTLIRELQQQKEAVCRGIEELEKPFGHMFVSKMSGIAGNSPVVQAAQLVQQAVRTAGFVWRIGGAEAERFLRASCDDPDVRWRRLLAAACREPNDGLLTVVAQFLRDPDPTGVVPIELLANIGRLSIEALRPLVDSPVAAVRTRTWAVLANDSERFVGNEGGRALASIEPQLVRALGDADPEIARTSFSFLCQSGARNRRGTELLLEWLPRANVFADANWSRPSLASVLRAARALGPYGATDEKRKAREFVAQVADAAAKGASEDRTAAQILDLMELGYGNTSMLVAAIGIATDPADLARAATLLDRGVDAEKAVGALTAKRDLPASVLAPLQQRLRTQLPSVPVQEPQREDAPRQSLSHEQQKAANECIALLQAIAKTGSPDAVPILQQVCAERPDYTIGVAWAGAMPLAGRCDAPAVSALLRELLISSNMWDPHTRDSLFAELVHRGDRDAIALYPQAYALGLSASGREESQGRSYRGVQWLLLGADAPSNPPGAPSPFSGYDAAAAARAFATLFASPALPEVMVDLAGWHGGIPQPVCALLLPVVRERLPELVRTFVDTSSPVPGSSTVTGPNRSAFTAKSLETLRRVCTRLAQATPADDSPESQQYRSIVAALLADSATRAVFAQNIADGAARFFAPELKAQLREHPNAVQLRRLVKAGIPPDTADWIAMLGAKNAWSAAQVLNTIEQPVDAVVVRAVEALLQAEAADVRVAASNTLGRLLSAGSVASLLPLLRDSNETVRTAATEALQRIRLYHEQTAFWANFQQGIDTGREAAAAKLLVQAKPDQPKDQRLLAIRSLAVLGAPEALPYLIDWTKDADAAVAEAARAAVAQIHQSAQAKK